MFRKYAERIGWSPEAKETFDVSKTQSESVRMLSEAAKEHKIWLIGGASSPSTDVRTVSEADFAWRLRRFHP